MLTFIFGFICAWTIIGIVCFISNLHDGNISLWDGSATTFILLPIYIICSPYLLVIRIKRYIKRKRG